ncbi:hypothetical protein QUA70_11735 [Microcoleus sp. LAD1_D5]|uniref:hypothetical protein n=1 Tax=unclassified Microcoleus TaxID=2642155 RepID=UPI002FD71172
MASRELGRINQIRFALDSIGTAVLDCNQVRAALLLPHQGFYSYLSERGSGKQLLVRGGIWRALIDILQSFFPFFIITRVIGFSGYILLWVRVAFKKIKQIY